MKKVLITGISGFLGQYIYKYKPDDVDITGTYFSNKPNLTNIETVQLDLLNIEDFIMQSGQYDVVIHCAAMANLSDCESQPDKAFKINSQAAEKLALWSKKQKSKFIFLSTDIVFDGRSGDYHESDLPNPINVYGKTKFKAEQNINVIHTNLMIIRLALCLGKGLANTKSFVDWFYDKLKRNEEIPLYSDEIRTPVSSKFAAKAIWNMINTDFTGTIHLTGSEKLSRYELGDKILEYLKYDKKHLLKKISSNTSSYPRPVDVSMKSTYLSNVLKLPQENLSTFINNIL